LDDFPRAENGGRTKHQNMRGRAAPLSSTSVKLFAVAAKMGSRYLDMLEACEATVGKNVTENLYERHLKPLFLGS